MPEAAIGFFTDVGVNAILAKAPLERALLFAMSGVSVGAADAIKLGLADAAIAPDTAAGLVSELAGVAGSTDPAQAIVRLMEAGTVEVGATPFCDQADLIGGGPVSSAAQFVGRVSNVPALAEIAKTLATRSPTALTAIFEAHMGARTLMSVEGTLKMDLRLARLLARLPDFAEGVRAVLVDKDQAPKWSPRDIAEVDRGDIIAAVKGAPQAGRSA